MHSDKNHVHAVLLHPAVFRLFTYRVQIMLKTLETINILFFAMNMLCDHLQLESTHPTQTNSLLHVQRHISNYELRPLYINRQQVQKDVLLNSYPGVCADYTIRSSLKHLLHNSDEKN